MINKILNQLDQLSKDELMTLNKAVIKMAKAKRSIESVIKSAILNVGQVVEINQKKHKGQKFIIKRIKRTNCLIHEKDGSAIYNCPISMLIS